MPALVLDSEALSRLARARSHRDLDRVRALLTVAARRGWPVRVPSVALAELYRTRSRESAVDAAITRYGVRSYATGSAVARHTGRILGREGLDSCHLVDAAVIATAVRDGGGVVVTGDVDDLRRLASGTNVSVTGV
jgi:predicted nucleic acid-binding protein